MERYVRYLTPTKMTNCDICRRLVQLVYISDCLPDNNAFDNMCEKCYIDYWEELPEPDDWNYPEPEELKETKPFDVYEGDDGVKIMCFNTDETHFAETQIFRYYDEKKWWLKHKTDDYFLLIETKPKKKKKIKLIK